MWDNVYSDKEYVYGREPNDFLRENIEFLIPGDVLCIAEGEGRNAVFLAKQGFEVTAVDSSLVGLTKIESLARENGVSIKTIHADLADYDFGKNKWQNVVSIFCHLPSHTRSGVHAGLYEGLLPGGIIMLEGYTPKQLEYKTGGPPNEDMMYSAAILKNDFSEFDIVRLEELERDVVEGTKHTGFASVVQLIASLSEKSRN